MQNPMKMGTVQSFFTYTAQDWPHGWNEIDVEIVPSVTENPFSMNIIWKDGQQDHNYATGFHPGSDWFTYTVEWTPDYVSWYVNDKLVRKSEGTEDVHFLEMPTQLMMNFWTPCWEPWNDYFDDAEMPWYAKYDFVEVYDYDQDKKEFNLRWRDDFNTFDSKKWYASDNWGFENNSSLFMSSQVYVEDGNLVLKMDYNDGHARTYPPHHQLVHSEKPKHEDPHHVQAHHEAKAPHQTKEHHDMKAVPHDTKPVMVEHKEPVHHAPIVHHTETVVHPALVHHAEVVHPTAVHHAEVIHPTAVHHAEVVHPAVVHHAEVVHPAVVHHAEVVHPAVVHHAEVAHHADVDVHTYDAPLVRHHAYAEETGYPHHYSEHEFEAVGHAYDALHEYPYAEHEYVEGKHFKHGYGEGDHEAHHYETVKYESRGYPEHHTEHAYH